jgi:hypothetical protein
MPDKQQEKYNPAPQKTTKKLIMPSRYRNLKNPTLIPKAFLLKN